MPDGLNSVRQRLENQKIDQKAVDNTLAALQAAVDAMTKEQVKTDKNALKEAIEEADSYLNATNVTYTEISRNTLQQARETAQRVYDDDTATQTQINRCVTNIESAIDPAFPVLHATVMFRI